MTPDPRGRRALTTREQRVASSDPAALEAQIEAARAQLAVTIDAIAERVAPKNVAEKAKSRAKGIVVNPDGSLKTDKVAIVGGVALTFVLVVVWRRFH